MKSEPPWRCVPLLRTYWSGVAPRQEGGAVRGAGRGQALTSSGRIEFRIICRIVRISAAQIAVHQNSSIVSVIGVAVDSQATSSSSAGVDDQRQQAERQDDERQGDQLDERLDERVDQSQDRPITT